MGGLQSLALSPFANEREPSSWFWPEQLELKADWRNFCVLGGLASYLKSGGLDEADSCKYT